jgi:hypothetical protein
VVSYRLFHINKRSNMTFKYTARNQKKTWSPYGFSHQILRSSSDLPRTGCDGHWSLPW